MAKLVELGGAPVNATEREIIEILLSGLSDDWSVIPNASMPHHDTGHPFEYDAIVIGPYAVHVVEVKGWRGLVQQLGQADWRLGGGKIVRNPLPLADHKARVLASHLKALSLGDRRPPYVQACLVVGSDATKLEIDAADAGRCLLPKDICNYLRTPPKGKLHGKPDDYRPVHSKLVRAVTGPLRAREVKERRYGSYLAKDLQDRDDERAVWLGRHAMLDEGRVYRIRAWYLSPYRYTAGEREKAAMRLMRAAEALAKVGDHPCVATLRDFGEQEGEFYEVTDWSEAGTLRSAAARGIVARLAPERKLALVRDIVEGLATAWQHGVVHRALSPSAILLLPDGHARVTDFDLAWVEGAQHTVYGSQPHPHISYLPPELRNPEDYEVFDNSDLFALARVLREVMGEGIPPELSPLLDRCVRDDPGERPTDPLALLKEIDALMGPVSSASVPRPEPSPESSSSPIPEASDFDALEPGRVIDGVNEVLERLGRGAGSTVYRVSNEPMGTELALKLIHGPSDGYDPATEYRLLRKVESEHVPRAHWLGRITSPDGRSLPYLLLDLVEGRRLRDVIADGPVALESALAWTDDLLDALHGLHTAGMSGVLHRDVKPDNIIIGSNGASLVDFGSARDGDQAGTAPEGTLRYTPPDLAETGWTAQADVFATGCVLYETLASRPPWEGPPSTAQPPLPLRKLRRDVPETIAAAVQRALAPRASDRFPSAEALREALREAARSAAPSETQLHVNITVEDAGRSLWTARRLQAITRHPDIGAPLGQALRECVVSPVDGSEEGLRQALLASEARAMALEAPLAEAMLSVYDQLLAGLPPTELAASEEEDGTAGIIDLENDERVLVLDGLHFTEWAMIESGARSFGRRVRAWVWSPGGPMTTAGGDDVLKRALRGRLIMSAVELSLGDRASLSLEGVLVARRRALEDALLEALSHAATLWVTSTRGCVYLGHGLRRDVGDGLGDRAGAARSAWTAAFPQGRSAPDGEPLPSAWLEPLRRAHGVRYPVGRLAWPDPPGTPWLQTGGLSLPERVLPLLQLSPEAQ